MVHIALIRSAVKPIFHTGTVLCQYHMSAAHSLCTCIRQGHPYHIWSACGAIGAHLFDKEQSTVSVPLDLYAACSCMLASVLLAFPALAIGPG